MTSTVTHMFHSNKNDSCSPRKFSVDEFSDFQDFQSAKSIPPPANSLTSKSFGLTFDSPLHVHPSKSSSSSTGPLSTTGNGFNNNNVKESIVGSRLANYDLMSPQHVSGVTSSSKGSTNSDNLLIGDEDKYSALRGLIDEISSSTITQQQGTINSSQNYVSHVDGNIEHKISLVNDDVLEIVKTETMDRSSSLDFGDFQSFSSLENTTYTYPSPAVSNYHHHNLDVNNFATKGTMVKKSSNEDHFTTNRVEQNSFSDGDFGDFVSFSGGVESILPPSPKIVLKTELCKKSSSSSSSSGTTSKSKKHSQGVSKISLSRIAKASNILIESPTYPRKVTGVNELTKISSFDDQQFSCYQGNNNHAMESSSSSFDLMTNEGFDFSLPSPTAGGGNSVQVDKVEFGAPLRTTLIGSALDDVNFATCKVNERWLTNDYKGQTNSATTCVEQNLSSFLDDEFGDFTTTVQVPMDSTKVNNSLDLLPLTKPKSKLKCPTGETQSIASLDLGNYLEDGKSCMDNETLENSHKFASNDWLGMNIEKETLEFEPYMKEDLSSSTINPSHDLGIQSAIQPGFGFHHAEEDHSSPSTFSSEDKYKCFKDEIESERERYNTEWNRCLTACLNLITYGQSILTSVSSSEVIREIISNEKGNAYIQNLIEVYVVASRIYLSWKRRSGISSSWNKEEDGVKIKQIFEEITTAWESLTPFIIGTSLMEKISNVNDWKEEGDYSDCSKLCGVCLSGTTDQNTESLIDYGGKFYHSNCANLFINEVDSILPSLYISML